LSEPEDSMVPQLLTPTGYPVNNTPQEPNITQEQDWFLKEIKYDTR
jgi:hypothetical protein